MRVGLLIIVTHRYHEFLRPLLDGADRHFFPGDDVTYFIFTDRHLGIDSGRPIVEVPIEHRPWPFMTLNRYKFFTESRELLSGMDHLYYCDVDMLFVGGKGGSSCLSRRWGRLRWAS